MRSLILALIALGLLGSPAMAADVDIGPLLTPVFGVLAVAVTFLVGWAIHWGGRLVKAKTGLELTALENQIRDVVNGFAYKGIDAALMAARSRIGKDGVLTIDNVFLATAAAFVAKAAPDYLVKLGVTRADGTVDMDRVRGMIEARLPTSNAAPYVLPAPPK